MKLPVARLRFRQLVAAPTLETAAAAFCLSQERTPGLDWHTYQQMLDTMAAAITPSAYPLKMMQRISHHLYDELGFRGNQADYYDPDNSYLDQVIERRLGIPISLAMVYLEVAKRLDFPMVGVGMPGHFLIKPATELEIYLDPFHGGEILFPEDCRTIFHRLQGEAAAWQPTYLVPVTPQALLFRWLNNLKLIYIHRRDLPQALTILDYLLLLRPREPINSRDRGLIHLQLGSLLEAREDLETYLVASQPGADYYQIQQLLTQINDSLT